MSGIVLKETLYVSNDSNPGIGFVCHRCNSAGCAPKSEAPAREEQPAAIGMDKMAGESADAALGDASEPADATPPEANPLIVTVNGNEIRQMDLLEQRDLMLRQGLQIGPQEALGQLIAEQLIGQAAEKAGQVVSASEVEEEFARLAEQSGGVEELTAQLKDAGLTPEDVKSDLRRQMNLKKVLDWKTAQIEIPDASVAEVVQSDPQSLERVKARHILIRSSEEDSEEDQTDAKTRIGAIADRLKAGEDFAEVAQQESEDPGSAVRGGDLGEFAHGEMVPPFEEAAFALEPGTISEIVQTQFGYHLIKSEERRTLTDDEVRGDLRKQMGNQVLRAWIEELQKDATIEFAPRLAPMGPGAMGR